ncbi:hypothetical protein NC652_029849 [Populus alba x Populus x berolinensis]|nr:hypothetical protein NC652_029849 [Populus alba x Populus x berolinensis]
MPTTHLRPSSMTPQQVLPLSRSTLLLSNPDDNLAQMVKPTCHHLRQGGEKQLQTVQPQPC